MVDVNATLLTTARQLDHSPVSNGQAEAALKATLLGQQYVADWQYLLAAAGRLYRMTIGGITAGGDVSLVTGGGAGTVIDTDQPEGIIGLDVGNYLIPVEVVVSCRVDLDADAEVGDIILFADRTQAPPTSVTGTIETPENQLDGGAAFVGRAFSAITADITDPVDSEVLDYENVRAAEFVSNGTATNLTNGIVVKLKMHYQPSRPNLIAGPCSLVVCWGGTAAVTGIASVLVGVVPASWFPTS